MSSGLDAFDEIEARGLNSPSSGAVWSGFGVSFELKVNLKTSTLDSE
jgi:hypothetical protein